MSERMSEEEFAKLYPSDDDRRDPDVCWAFIDRIVAEARRAREGEEIEARRANGAELLVDAKDVEIAALRADIEFEREVASVLGRSYDKRLAEIKAMEQINAMQKKNWMENFDAEVTEREKAEAECLELRAEVERLRRG